MSGGGGKGGGGSQTTGYQYFFDLHMGVCRGPVDYLKAIRAADRTAYLGETTANTVIEIDKPDLFGGDKSEGGLVGDLTVMMGRPDQIVDPDIKSMIGEPCPDFRGALTLYYSGQISANNPYPKPWKMRVARGLKGWTNDDPWYPEKAFIIVPADNEPTANIHSLNPAHIIYECATNKEWGRGWSREFIDETSFQHAANVLYDEGFGLCMKYNRQDGLTAFISKVISHAGMAVYISRVTGLLTMKLIRNDYDPNAIPVFDSNSGLLDVQDDSQAMTTSSVNEVIVTYLDPNKNEKGQVRTQSLGGVQAYGVLSSTIEYLGIPKFDLAARVAQRDLRANALALKKYTLKMDRRAWKLAPADVFILRDPSRGIESIVLRVGKIEDKLFTDGSIEVQAAQDVFGLPVTSFAGYNPGTWVPPDTTPMPPEYTDMHEASYRDLALVLNASELAAILPESGTIATLAARPSPLAMNYRVWSRVGVAAFVQGQPAEWAPHGLLTTSIDEFDTTVLVDTFTDVDNVTVQPGEAVLIGTEVMKLVLRVGGTLTVARGCADTIPAPHAAGEDVWFYQNYLGSDRKEYVQSETVDAKFVTHTSTGDYSVALSPVESVTMNRRQFRPYPPGKLMVGAQNFAEVTSVMGDVVLTWAHRDRIIQDDTLVDHEAASIGPEPGTTYTVRVYNGVTLVRTAAGIVGTTWTYDFAMAEADGWIPTLTMEVESSRGGFASLQKYRFTFDHGPLGPHRPTITGAPGPIDVGSANPFISGLGDNGATIDIYVGGVFTGQSVVVSGGAWSAVMTGPLSLGAKSVTVIAHDMFGSSPPSTALVLNVKWYDPASALHLDFKGRRYWRNGVETLGLSALTSLLTITTSPQISTNVNGLLVYTAANALPLNDAGLELWTAATNLITSNSWNPATGAVTGITVISGTGTITSGTDAQAALGIMADASIATIRTTGNAYDFNNTAGVTDTVYEFAHNVLPSTALHSWLAYVWGDGGQFETSNVSPQTLVTFAVSAAYQRVTKNGFTPGATSDKIRLRVAAGKRVHLIGQHLETGEIVTAPIITTTAAVTRNAPSITLTLNTSTDFNVVEGYISARCKLATATVANNGLVATVKVPDASNMHYYQYLTVLNLRGGTILGGSGTTGFLSDKSISGTATAIHQPVWGYKINDYAYVMDGGSIATKTSGTVAPPSTGPVVLRIGDNTASCMKGVLENYKIGRTKLTNAELQRMSAWVMAA